MTDTHDRDKNPYRRPSGDDPAVAAADQVDGGHELVTDHALTVSEELLERNQSLAQATAEIGGAQRLEAEIMSRDAHQIDTAVATLDPELDPDDAPRATSKLKLYVKRFLRNYTAVAGLVIFIAIAGFGIFGELFAAHKFDDVDFMNIQSPPGTEGHIFGTNGAGNDVFAQLAHGIQRSLVIGIVVSLATTVIAAVIGSIAAYIGGWLERVILEVIHFLLVVPTFLVLALISNRAGGDWRVLIIVLIIFGWMFYARVVWTMALSLREREYVAAARYMGLGPFTVVWRHIIPNIGSLLTIHFTLGVVGTIQSETALSFLGFGVKVPDVSLGNLIADGAGNLFGAPWLFWFPAVSLTLLTVSMAFIADGLRDALDPNSAAGGRA